MRTDLRARAFVMCAGALLACGGRGPNKDLRRASVQVTAELGSPVQVAYTIDSTRLLVFVPDSLFADSATFLARSEGIARSALRAYRRSAQVDSVMVSAGSVAVEGFARRVRYQTAFAASALR